MQCVRPDESSRECNTLCMVQIPCGLDGPLVAHTVYCNSLTNEATRFVVYFCLSWLESCFTPKQSSKILKSSFVLVIVG